MQVTYDPAKDAENLRKHGISLKRAEDFDFTSAFFDRDDSQDYGEERWGAIGWLDAIVHTLVFRFEAESIRVISLRNRPKKREDSMPKTREHCGVPDAENPEWTQERFEGAKRLSDLPEGMQQLLRPKTRGPQKAATKELVSLRLSPDVLVALRATGPRWQTRVDEALRETFLKGATRKKLSPGG